jgi:dephospho-CoA kinase
MSSFKGPLIIGLTGSIGMGKTETARMFARLGLPVYDADAAVHSLYELGGAAVEPIARYFPDCIVEGRVDRRRLGARVAADSREFEILEKLVHPLVAHDQQCFLEQARQQGADMVVLDIPLLLEGGGEARVDAVVVVSAPASVQRARVLAREGMTEAMLDSILSKQMPDAEKRAKAHFVIETEKGLDVAFAQVKTVVDKLRERKSNHA